MAILTGKERIGAILGGKRTGDVGLHEYFWPETLPKWKHEGHLKESETPEEHFNFDMVTAGTFDIKPEPFKPFEIIEDNGVTQLVRDGNGAVLQMHKEHTSTPEHVSFAVQCREDWDRLLRPFLSPKKAMIKTEGYVMRRNACAEKQRFFLWAGVSVFEYLSAVCGHEVLLMNMALDPDWIKDMANTYCETQLALFEMLFEEVGKPDGFWFNEDLGFKGRPFMSQAMYRELIMPFHRRTYDYCHSHNLPIVMHSCGFVEPLISDLIEAGIDCLQTMEVKAGMDTLRIFKNYGDRIALCGGMDTRNIAASDCAAMEKELNDKLAVLRNGRYILQSDHSIPPDCEYQSYKHFVEMGTKLGERNQ